MRPSAFLLLHSDIIAVISVRRYVPVLRQHSSPLPFQYVPSVFSRVSQCVVVPRDTHFPTRIVHHVVFRDTHKTILVPACVMIAFLLLPRLRTICLRIHVTKVSVRVVAVIVILSNKTVFFRHQTIDIVIVVCYALIRVRDLLDVSVFVVVRAFRSVYIFAAILNRR